MVFVFIVKITAMAMCILLHPANVRGLWKAVKGETRGETLPLIWGIFLLITLLN